MLNLTTKSSSGDAWLATGALKNGRNSSKSIPKVRKTFCKASESVGEKTSAMSREKRYLGKMDDLDNCSLKKSLLRLKGTFTKLIRQLTLQI